MFSKSTTFFLLLPIAALGAPFTHHAAPLKRANDILNARQAIPYSYIVALKPDAVNPTNRGPWLEKVLGEGDITVSSEEMAADPAFKLKWDLNVFDGLAGIFDEEAIEVLRTREEVDWITEDIEVYTTDIVTQTNAPWNLARLTSGTESLRGLGTSRLNFEYEFDDEHTGIGSDVYILDTGVRLSHIDFQGRARTLGHFGRGVRDQDINGHGTHCAGSAAGSVFGVAKGASIISVKVMADDGGGSTSDIISGINLSVQNALANPDRLAVISMSLGGPQNRALDEAVQNSVRLGIPVVVAAGNESQNADNVSPARVREAITVGATTINDQVASFSNFGSALDIFAPGQEILSAGRSSDDAVTSLSGTSMATPQVAGLALVILNREGQMSPADLQRLIVRLGTKNVVGNVGRSGSPNLLASTGV